uniref:Glucose-6-phosphate isomerase n=1 Tax=Dermatophagoides pteronyssinus TaxID=6956 RepID=A0A6P6YKH3_DERPT|nr:glucose-6-phosphate isomerase, cytosolic A-like [Dermatophagoides pteronyssinus]
MFGGALCNSTERRAVAHMALRGTPVSLNGQGLEKLAAGVLQKVFRFAESVRSGETRGISGRRLVNVVCVGIGGSYLGLDFVRTALETSKDGCASCSGLRLRLLSNVDPVDAFRTLRDLDAAETLVVVISKTFTTAETMLNANVAKEWLAQRLGAAAVPQHFCAVSTAVDKCAAFGIQAERVFEFWDWVGGRYSVTSAVGVLPLALYFGPPVVQQFLAGARAGDEDVLRNRVASVAARLALVTVWNAVYLKFGCLAVLPYAQCLARFPAHVQQLSMESNGKRVTKDGVPFPDLSLSGEIVFGEPGTNGQHSFYQMIHQGRVIPCDFIGFCKSQTNLKIAGERLSLHDELMSNFFAQPDALAFGKSAEQLAAEGVPAELVPHKVFTGNRPSLSLLFREAANAHNVGLLLAIYEHRVAIYGFLMGMNSFDQWGVELGKVLAKNVKAALEKSRQQLSSCFLLQMADDSIEGKIRTIGRGSYGTVILVENKETHQRFACKWIPKNKFRAGRLEKFRTEIKLMRRCDHPNIVKIFEYYEDAEDFYLIEESCPGGELFDFLTGPHYFANVDSGTREGGRAIEKRAAGIMLQLLNGINYLHLRGIVHRDIKPENILLAEPNDVSVLKIIDFGLSSKILPEAAMKDQLGTPYYIAPEVLARNYDFKCDIWSLGVVLYILICGKAPFNGPTDEAVIQKVREKKYAMNDAVWAHVSPECKDLIAHMIVSPAEQRYTAAECLQHPC